MTQTMQYTHILPAELQICSNIMLHFQFDVLTALSIIFLCKLRSLLQSQKNEKRIIVCVETKEVLTVIIHLHSSPALSPN